MLGLLGPFGSGPGGHTAAYGMETADSNSLCCSVGLLREQRVGAPRLEGDRQCCHPGGCGASCIPSLWHGQAGRGGPIGCSVPALSSAQGSCAGREPARDGPQRSKWDLAGHSLSWAPRASLGRVQGGVNAAVLQFHPRGCGSA